MFRGLYVNDQDKIMMMNSIKTENELRTEIMKEFLKRIMRLFRRKEMRKEEGKESNSGSENADQSQFIWNQEEDPMDLNQFSTKKRKCFNCEKIEHIR